MVCTLSRRIPTVPRDIEVCTSVKLNDGFGELLNDALKLFFVPLINVYDWFSATGQDDVEDGVLNTIVLVFK